MKKFSGTLVPNPQVQHPSVSYPPILLPTFGLTPPFPLSLVVLPSKQVRLSSSPPIWYRLWFFNFFFHFAGKNPPCRSASFEPLSLSLFLPEGVFWRIACSRFKFCLLQFTHAVSLKLDVFGYGHFFFPFQPPFIEGLRW